MNNDKTTSGNVDTPQRALPFLSGFSAIEVLQQTTREVSGVDCEYRQLESGQLGAGVWLRSLNTGLLQCESVNRRVEARATMPMDMVSIFVPRPGVDIEINGFQLVDDKFLLIPPGGAVHAVSQACPKVFSLYIPERLLSQDADALSRGQLNFSGASAIAATVGPRLVNRLSCLLLQCLYMSNSEESMMNVEAEIITELVSLINKSGSLNGVDDKYHRIKKRRVLRRAIDYMTSHMHEPIRMADLCAYAGTSMSTLGRLFRRELKQTPSAYLQACRLNAVRCDLRRNDADRSIAQIAMDYGFSHMGRFAAAYHNQFGYLPSQDRAR